MGGFGGSNTTEPEDMGQEPGWGCSRCWASMLHVVRSPPRLSQGWDASSAGDCSFAAWKVRLQRLVQEDCLDLDTKHVGLTNGSYCFFCCLSILKTDHMYSSWKLQNKMDNIVTLVFDRIDL